MTRPAVAVVLNGSAGALLEKPDAIKELKAQFEAAGLEPNFIPHDAGTLPERIALAAKSGASAVVAAGGDGTIACAAQVLAGTETPMGLLPFGTMNLLAKDLGIPVGDTEAAIRVLAAMQVRSIDVGEVNGHVFTCASMLGLPARMARYREGGRGHLSGPRLWSRMARATLRALAHGASMRIAVTAGQETVRARTTALTIAVNPIDESTGRTFGRPRLDGGELAVYQIERLRPLDLVRLALRTITGKVRQDPSVREMRAEQLTIASARRSLRVMNDGEVQLLRPPLRYSIRPGALRVIAPAAEPPP